MIGNRPHIADIKLGIHSTVHIKGDSPLEISMSNANVEANIPDMTPRRMFTIAVHDALEGYSRSHYAKVCEVREKISSIIAELKFN